MCNYQCTKSVLSNCGIESNKIEKSIRQHESNRIEYFSTNRNALTGSCTTRQRVDRNFIPGSITHHLVQQYRSVRKQDLTRTT